MYKLQFGPSGLNPAMSIKNVLSKVIHHPNGERRSSSPGHPSPDHSPSPGPGHRKSIATYLFDKEYVSSSDNESSGYDTDTISKKAMKRRARKAQHESKSRMSLESRDESEERAKKRLEEAAKTETAEMKSRYGDLPLMQSTARGTDNRINFDSIGPHMIDQEVVFRCRLHHVRAMGAKLTFLIFRQQINTLQGVLVEQPGVVSQVMLNWAEHIRTGSVIRVKGVIQKPEAPVVKSASIHNVEIRVTDLKVIVTRPEPSMRPFLMAYLGRHC